MNEDYERKLRNAYLDMQRHVHGPRWKWLPENRNTLLKWIKKE